MYYKRNIFRLTPIKSLHIIMTERRDFMQDVVFQVIINNDGNKINGYLTEIDKGRQVFNPLNVLADLSSPNLRMEIGNEYSALMTNSIEELWEDTSDVYDYSVECGFEHLIKIQDNERDLYVRCVKDIRKIMKLDHTITYQELELFKTYLDITTQVTIMNRNENPLHKIIKGILPTETVPISYGYYSLEEAFKQRLENNIIYLYDCFSLRDVIFAILHYLTIHDYKFTKCMHCGRYFTTKNLKQKYCKRTSPYINYKEENLKPDKECEEAVRLIQKRLRERRINLYKDFNENKDKDDQKFLNEYRPYEDEIKKYPTLKNLRKYEYFLYHENKLGK